VLELLLGADGAVVSTEQILERAWDDAVDPFTNTVRMTISRLRAKLGDPPLIETVTPVGYRIGAACSASAAPRRAGSFTGCGTPARRSAGG
jgi:DNA-binding response OmpR family regulator